VETVPLGEVPSTVIKTAVKAASLIGDGLYGVDLKMLNGEVYVIEINDNPNIDAGIEDHVLKEELYGRIIRSLINRIEINRNIAQFVTV
jgi:glutathione synthase/RimK-type ligase-like ATP-grasp enzyme